VKREARWVLLVLSALALACQETDERAAAPDAAPASETTPPPSTPAAETVPAVSVHPGYIMPELMGEPPANATAENLAKYRTQPWTGGEFKVYEEPNTDATFSLTSCESYESRASAKLTTVAAFEVGPFRQTALMCRATRIMLDAKKPETSHVGTLVFDQALPGKMPKELAMVISGDDQARLSAGGVVHWSDFAEPTGVEPLGELHSKYLHKGGAQELALVARGDFDGDSVEDLLVSLLDTVEGGSYASYRLLSLTRRSDDGDFELLKEYEY